MFSVYLKLLPSEIQQWHKKAMGKENQETTLVLFIKNELFYADSL